jgi:hypothetical protein
LRKIDFLEPDSTYFSLQVIDSSSGVWRFGLFRPFRTLFPQHARGRSRCEGAKLARANFATLPDARLSTVSWWHSRLVSVTNRLTSSSSQRVHRTGWASAVRVAMAGRGSLADQRVVAQGAVSNCPQVCHMGNPRAERPRLSLRCGKLTSRNAGAAGRSASRA